MTAHDTMTMEAGQMNARIARLEEDRALRTRELLRVEREVVDLRSKLQKTSTALYYQEETNKLLQAKIDRYEGGAHEDPGETQSLSFDERGSLDGLPRPGDGAEQDADTYGELRRGPDAES